MKLQELLNAAAPGKSIDLNPYFEYLWTWPGKQIEEGMVFQDGGNSSLTLEFLLFCSGAVPSIVEYKNRSTSNVNGKQEVRSLTGETTTSDGNILFRGNSCTD